MGQSRLGKMFVKVLICLALALALAHGAQKSYIGFKVFETEPLSEESANLLHKVMSRHDKDKFDFWRPPRKGRQARIMAAPSNVHELEATLKMFNIKFSVDSNDVQKLIELSKGKGGRSTPRDTITDWEDYHSYDQIVGYLDEVAATYDFCSTEVIGQSVEGRDLKVLKFERAGPGAKNVWIEANIHAREWIANAVATYQIKELLENDAVDSTYLDNLNIYILPMANPDGYEYSRNTERLWRKNRADNAGAPNCKGVDLNRNWPFHFGESGVSPVPCSDVFNSLAPLDQPESSAMANFYDALTPKAELAIAFHSALDQILYPYGYDYNQFPDNVDEIIELCNDAVDALYAVNGYRFTCINSAELYPAAGASDDYYQSEGTRFSYTPELRDDGFGFLLPPQYIIPSGEEIFAALSTMLDKLLE